MTVDHWSKRSNHRMDEGGQFPPVEHPLRSKLEQPLPHAASTAPRRSARNRSGGQPCAPAHRPAPSTVCCPQPSDGPIALNLLSRAIGHRALQASTAVVRAQASLRTTERRRLSCGHSALWLRDTCKRICRFWLPSARRPNVDGCQSCYADTKAGAARENKAFLGSFRAQHAGRRRPSPRRGTEVESQSHLCL